MNCQQCYAPLNFDCQCKTCQDLGDSRKKRIRCHVCDVMFGAVYRKEYFRLAQKEADETRKRLKG